MTAPPPVPSGQLSPADAVTQWKAFDQYTRLALVRAHLFWALVLAGILGLVTIGAFKLYDRYTNDMAKDAAHAKLLEAKYDSADARADRWEQRAEVATAAVRVDTQLVTRVIESAPKPVLVPVTEPGGVTSIVPMIPAVSFDSLGASCSRLEHDCTQALASKDSVNAQLRAALAAGDSLVAVRTREAKAAEHANFWSKIIYGSGGFAIGRASCSVH